MTDQENVYLSPAELALYNQIYKDIERTNSSDNKELLSQNAFNLINRAMYKHFLLRCKMEK